MVKFATAILFTRLHESNGFTKPSSPLNASRLIQGKEGLLLKPFRGLTFLPDYHDRVAGLRFITLKESTSGNDEPKRKRRKRKDGKNAASIENSDVVEPSNIQVQEDKVEDPPVQSSTLTPPPPTMEIMDVRDLVSGKKPSQPSTTAKEAVMTDDSEDDDDEYEYYYEDEDGKEVVVGTATSSSSDNSLEKLLADAKRMREQESGSSDVGEPEETLKSKVKNVLSTIVTADFFVVCALLAWFLAGIFCSYIIKDDTVQIAFNGM